MWVWFSRLFCPPPPQTPPKPYLLLSQAQERAPLLPRSIHQATSYRRGVNMVSVFGFLFSTELSPQLSDESLFLWPKDF